MRRIGGGAASHSKDFSGFDSTSADGFADASGLTRLNFVSSVRSYPTGRSQSLLADDSEFTNSSGVLKTQNVTHSSPRGREENQVEFTKLRFSGGGSTRRANEIQSPSPTSARLTSLSASVSSPAQVAHKRGELSPTCRWHVNAQKTNVKNLLSYSPIALLPLRKKAAFTLAEVLITLGIIGVVAALTLPALITNYQKKLTVEQLKETYSILSQAVRMSEAHNGEVQYWDMTGESANTTSAYPHNEKFAKTYITPYLNKIQECNHPNPECWGTDYKWLNGNIDTYRNRSYNHSYSVILANGSILGIWSRGDWVELWVDLNGAKAPNTAGKDTFFLILSKPKSSEHVYGGKSSSKVGLSFYGYAKDRDREYYKTQGYPCGKTGTLTGSYCGALIFVDGWEIRDDYPW